MKHDVMESILQSGVERFQFYQKYLKLCNCTSNIPHCFFFKSNLNKNAGNGKTCVSNCQRLYLRLHAKSPFLNFERSWSFLKILELIVIIVLSYLSPETFDISIA